MVYATHLKPIWPSEISLKARHTINSLVHSFNVIAVTSRPTQCYSVVHYAQHWAFCAISNGAAQYRWHALDCSSMTSASHSLRQYRKVLRNWGDPPVLHIFSMCTILRANFPSCKMYANLYLAFQWVYNCTHFLNDVLNVLVKVLHRSVAAVCAILVHGIAPKGAIVMNIYYMIYHKFWSQYIAIYTFRRNYGTSTVCRGACTLVIRSV